MLMLFCAATAWAFEPGANITDLSALTDGGYVCFKNVGRVKFIYENSDKKILNGNDVASLAYVWQVHVEEGGKYSFSSVLGNYISTPLDGKDVYTVAVDNEAKDEFAITAHNENAVNWKLQSTNNPNIYWDGQDARFVGWQGSGTNSQYEIIPVSVTTDEINAYINSYWGNLVEAKRAAAKEEVELLAKVSSVYPSAASTVEQIDAVQLNGNTEADANEAIAAINGCVSSYKVNAYKALDGKFFTLYTAGRKQYAKMTATGTAAAATATSPDFIWQFVENNGAVNIYNPYIGKYLGALGNAGDPSIAVTANQAEAGAYNVGVVTEEVKDDQGNVTGENVWLAFNVGGAYIHLNGSLLPWYAGGASYWTIAEVSDFADMVSAHKNSSLATLDSWKSLSVVFDAALVDAAKTAINGINSTDWATFAAIDAELTKVTDAVAAKHVVFKNSNTTDPNRSEVYLATDMSDSKGRGNKEFDYNAVWNLQSAGGASFYLYNALNKVYLGTPGSEGALTSSPAAAFTFEVVDASTSLVEIKTGGQTMHVHNWADCTLTNYDGDETASRWYVSIFDITTDIQALIEANASNHADVPELGQYPTAAYNALVAAKSTVKNAGEVEAAIAAFQKSLNTPVYFITSKHNGYAAGSAILYNGSEWRWAAANKYNKQMWMTIPGYTEENVPAVDAYDAEGTSYAICDYLTGTKMRGKDVQIVKVADWEGAYNLQYNANAESTDAAQHAKDNGQLVNWKPGTTTDAQASVWGVEYIGNTYDLDKLTDEHINALAAMQTAYSAKVRYADVVIGDGIGQYQGNKDALVAALEAAETITGKSLVELATMSVDDILDVKDAINNAEALVINQPKAGFYRIKSMNANSENKKEQSLLVSDGALALDKTESAASIMYIDAANCILNYGSGLYINTYKAPAEVGAQAVGWNFVENAQVAGTYALKYNTGDHMGYYLSDWNSDVNVTFGQNDANAAWIFEEVTELPVVVSAAGFATLYAPVALTIADGVTAYTAAVEGKTLVLNEVEGTVIPAETGVILEAAAGSYNFAVAADVDAIEGNALVGSYAKSVKNAEAKVYTLQKPAEKEVGFYLFKGQDAEGNTTYINGFRAWVEVAEGEEAPAMFTLGRGGDDEDATGIDQLINNGEVVIYDLSGRRVEKMEKGIYIVNGKKVVK